MKSWRERDPQLAALFNPAFCACIVYTAVNRFQKSDHQGLPFPLLFLILPVVLNRSVRETLPSSTRTPFHLWIARSPEIKIGFAHRVSNLVPITQEALLFLLQRQRVRSEQARIMKWKPIRGLSSLTQGTTEIAELTNSARILGGVLAKAHDAESVFIALGITI